MAGARTMSGTPRPIAPALAGCLPSAGGPTSARPSSRRPSPAMSRGIRLIRGRRRRFWPHLRAIRSFRAAWASSRSGRTTSWFSSAGRRRTWSCNGPPTATPPTSAACRASGAASTRRRTTFRGRLIGGIVGQDAFRLARSYFRGEDRQTKTGKGAQPEQARRAGMASE